MRYIVRSVDGAEYGPFTRRELQHLVRERRLGPGDFVRREGGRTWSPFERIAGLSDLASEPSPESPPAAVEGVARPASSDDATVDRISAAPVRPRLEAAPEWLGDRPSPGPAPDAPSSSELEPDADGIPGFMATDPPPTSTRRPSLASVDPARSQNPFVAAGLPIDFVAGEEVQFVLVQSFIDALRDSMFGALLGHRSRLVCTDRRAVVIRPGIGRTSMTVAWLDRMHHAGIETRLSLVRLVFGVICLLYAVYALVASTAGNLILRSLGANAAGMGGAFAIIGFMIAGIAGLLGLLLMTTAWSRGVTVGDDVQFPCAAAGPWHLARIDEGRMHAVGERFND